MPEMAVKLLKGPVSVAFSKRGRFHYATALEFDLVGIGSSRDKALSELQDVVNTYLTEAVSSDDPVRLEFPSPREDWLSEDRLSFVVTVLLVGVSGHSSPVIDGIDELRKRRDSVRMFSLLPLAPALGGTLGQSRWAH